MTITFFTESFHSKDVNFRMYVAVMGYGVVGSGVAALLEKNHEYIRYVVPKKRSLNPYTQKDMTLLMNHINSTKCPGLGNKSPYEFLKAKYKGFLII